MAQLSPSPESLAVRPYPIRCDAACPAEALIRVIRHPNKELAFCRHHYREYALALMADGWYLAAA